MVLIKADAPGVDIRPIRNLTGGSEFCEVFFTNARTPLDLVVGEPNRGWEVAMGALGTERGTTLLAEQLTTVRKVSDLIDTARVGGKSDDRVLRGRLAQAWIECKVMQWNSLRLMTMIKQDPAAAMAQASISKVYASGSHQRLGELAMSVIGPASELVTDSYELSTSQETFLGSRAESIYGGTTQVQLNILAERSLGLPREPRGA